MSARRYALAVAAMFVGTLGVLAAFVAHVDPYWLWRQEVAWRYNAAYETRMRFAKSLQMLQRRPRTVLIGSSVVYRGMNPADVALDDTYNLGISSLRIREAETYVHALLRWSRPERIVLAVEYFAFDRLRPSESGFDPTLAETGSLARSAFGAFASATAVTDAWRLMRKHAGDPDGTWQRDGYKATRSRSPEEVAATLAMTHALFSKTDVDPAELAALVRIMDAARAARVELKLFVPPYHRSWLETAQTALRSGMRFAEWIAAVERIARSGGVELWDFATSNPYADTLVGQGNAYYLDPSHFTPLMGRWILARLGLPVHLHGPEVPTGFGVRLVPAHGS